ncbi:MAG TPA: glucose dehydrogenase [Armatimonadota bacterium]|nr:glucose dehydrogenase [Armatimonadota bacterium]
MTHSIGDSFMASAAERFFLERHVNPDALGVPVGFRIEVAATGLNNPSSIDFDEEGSIYIGEMGSPTASACEPGRIVRVRPDGSSEVAASDFSGSITGLVYYQGAFYAVEHGHPGRVYRVYEDGTRDVLVDGLPGGGDHPTSGIVVAHSERLYFGQGTRTNAGVVGPDDAWLGDHPELCDIPGADITLTGRNFESPNPFRPGTVLTGAFEPFGTASREGGLVKGEIRCSGAIMRVDPDGGEFELFAWGFRQPFGLSVHPDGRIFCTDTGMENRGSRRIADGREYIWQVTEGSWYGWPDYAGCEPVTHPKFKPPDAGQPEFLLKEHPALPVKPVAWLPVGSGIAKFDFARSPLFGSPDTAFVALMGTIGTQTQAQDPKIVTIDVATGAVDDFITNRHPGPASAYRSGGFERPIAMKFDRTGEAAYILDLGVLGIGPNGTPTTLKNTGVLWRISPAVLA